MSEVASQIHAAISQCTVVCLYNVGQKLLVVFMKVSIYLFTWHEMHEIIITEK